MRLNPFHIALLAASAAAVGPAWAAFNSQTFIPPGQTFLLGGGQPGAFRVQGRNIGTVPVTIRSELNGAISFVATIAPGQSVDTQFQKGQMAQFENTSKKETARVSLRLTQDVSGLAMRYTGLGAN